MQALVMVRSLDIRKTRAGKNYGALRLSLGKAGNHAEIDAKLWDIDAVCPGDKRPESGDLLRVDYEENDYNGSVQWVVRGFVCIGGRDREAALPDFSPPDRIDREYYERLFAELLGSIPKDRVCGQVARTMFQRPGLCEAFFNAPAARDFHQAYPGGLLEHTLNVTSLALALADAYAAPGRPGLTFNQTLVYVDRPLLIAAGLLHDIGKTATYRFSPQPEVTPVNNWEGHLPLGYAWVREAAAPLMAAPPYPAALDEISKLLHCILAHHGSLEFGSPVVPACAEAFLLAQADMTDARMAEIAQLGHETLERDPQTQWLARNMHFRGGIYVGDWPRAALDSERS